MLRGIHNMERRTVILAQVSLHVNVCCNFREIEHAAIDCIDGYGWYRDVSVTIFNADHTYLRSVCGFTTKLWGAYKIAE